MALRTSWQLDNPAAVLEEGAQHPRLAMMYIAEAQPAAVLVAPDRVNAESRLAFRRQALEYLERASHAKTAFVLDLRGTTDIDASGLGILVLLQKRAREYGLVTRLIGPSVAVRDALNAARLDYLFEIVE